MHPQKSKNRATHNPTPALPNGLSFNKETGTISGAPIVAADPVTYVITAYGFYFFDDTATVVRLIFF
jgi:hypothetical protein